MIMTKLNEIICGSGKGREIKGTNLRNFSSRYQNHPGREPYSKTVFQCPLKCEGNKTFMIPGTCRVCNVTLEQVAELHQNYYL